MTSENGNTYRVTIIVTVPPQDGNPAKWDWRTLLDVVEPVTVEMVEVVR